MRKNSRAWPFTRTGKKGFYLFLWKTTPFLMNHLLDLFTMADWSNDCAKGLLLFLSTNYLSHPRLLIIVLQYSGMTL